MNPRNTSSSVGRKALESLEQRLFLTVGAPYLASASISREFNGLPTGVFGTYADIGIVDPNDGESGYRIQWSEDAVNWPGAVAPGADVEVGEFIVGAHPGQGVFNVVHDLDAGQRLYYRAQALDGASPPSAFSPAVRSTNDARTATLQPEVRATPAGLRISWSADLSPDSAVALYRKLRSQQEFAQISYANREPHAVTDPDVQADVRYEYRLDVTPPGAPTRRAFVAAGISLSRVEQRGNVLIVVDEELYPSLTNELLQFRKDLVGDGWNVREITVARDSGDAQSRQEVRAIKSEIETVNNAVAGGLRSIVLVGHVPVP